MLANEHTVAAVGVAYGYRLLNQAVQIASDYSVSNRLGRAQEALDMAVHVFAAFSVPTEEYVGVYAAANRLVLDLVVSRPSS